MNQNFEYEGQTFEIKEAIFNERYTVKVFLNGEQVSPEYSATLEVGHDYFSQYQKHIVDALFKIAKDDIRNGIYFKN